MRDLVETIVILLCGGWIGFCLAGLAERPCPPGGKVVDHVAFTGLRAGVGGGDPFQLKE